MPTPQKPSPTRHDTKRLQITAVLDADALLDLAARAAPDRVICVATLHRDSDYLCLLPLNKRVGRCERVPLLGRIPVLLILSKAMVTKNNFYTL
jgi:hypothetical protein